MFIIHIKETNTFISTTTETPPHFPSDSLLFLSNKFQSIFRITEILIFSAMNLFGFLLILTLSSIASAYEKFDSHLLPRPLILEYPNNIEIRFKESDEYLQLLCSSWRFAVETNNLTPWKTIPSECAGFVKDYMTGKAYNFDLEMVSKEAGIYARSIQLVGDGNDVWIFDIDETLLSNLPYYADHGYGLEVFDGHEFDKWVEKGLAPAIESSLKLYEEVLGLGFKVFLLTGRSERHRSVTVENLRNAGFQNWDKLLLRY
ncbi:hypothetical protein HHK36_000918 [Tetracentron sinense]|uniref:Acid phosphatase n=1 Tax=Tetracentron sinense TaxID=13715 RepID=A0A834ZT22_TETSI|nr:hypothetical protein HHK36_000918 [Tetracentron sinense]